MVETLQLLVKMREQMLQLCILRKLNKKKKKRENERGSYRVNLLVFSQHGVGFLDRNNYS